MESTLERPILKALLNLDDLENVFVLGCRVDILLKELFDHFLLGCFYRVGVAHYMNDSGEEVVARVYRVLRHLKSDIPKVDVVFCISHNLVNRIRF